MVVRSNFADIAQIYLAMEMDEYDAINKAQTLIKLFAGRFRRITYARHPSGIAGEVKGRSSVVAWAAKDVVRFYNGSNIWSTSVLVTVVERKCGPSIHCSSRD